LTVISRENSAKSRKILLKTRLLKKAVFLYNWLLAPFNEVYGLFLSGE